MSTVVLHSKPVALFLLLRFPRKKLFFNNILLLGS